MIIPFFIPHSGCPHQCVFCNQKSITGRSRSDDAASIPDTVARYLNARTRRGPVQVAFYGGSFTALSFDAQRGLLEAVRPFIEKRQVETIRLSTRPDCISPAVIELLRAHHVTIVELGAQSMDDRVLSLAGRGHAAADTASAVRLLKDARFTVGLQLMPGLPGDNAPRFASTLGEVVRLAPDFVRLYPALVLRGTPLESLYRSGQFTPLTLDDAILLCAEALLKFEQAGIKVIRMGLQPTEELEKPGTIVAGPYHPSFGEMVESAILLERMRAALKSMAAAPLRVEFYVHPRDVSAAAGHRRRNIERLKKEFCLQEVRIRAEEKNGRREVTIRF